jgi:arsenite methyltransferase
MKTQMIISDLITTKENNNNNINIDNWCSCIDGTLTKENYLQSIKDAGFQNIEILNEKPTWMNTILMTVAKSLV